MEYIDCLFTSSLGCFIGVNVSFDELKSTRPYPAVPSQILFCWSFTIVQIKFDGILWGVLEHEDYCLIGIILHHELRSKCCHGNLPLCHLQ